MLPFYKAHARDRMEESVVVAAAAVAVVVVADCVPQSVILVWLVAAGFRFGAKLALTLRVQDWPIC
jgi:hypothetical protein